MLILITDRTHITCFAEKRQAATGNIFEGIES